MISKRQRRLAAKREEAALSSKFTQIDLSVAKYVPPGMTRSYRNNKFTVMVYDRTLTTHGYCTKALIQSHYDKPIERHWATIQGIKNEIFGKEITAIEYYPAESALIDHHNIYWIWMFPDGILPVLLLPISEQNPERSVNKNDNHENSRNEADKGV